MEYLNEAEKEDLKIIKELRNKEFTETDTLLVSLYMFDWNVDNNGYNDNEIVSRREELKRKIENLEPSSLKGEMLAYFHEKNKNKKEIFNNYPWLPYHYYKLIKPKGFVGMALDEVPPAKVAVALRTLIRIDDLLTEYNFRPVSPINHRYIWSPYAPTSEFMHQLEDEFVGKNYRTLHVPWRIQKEINKLSELGKDLFEFISKYNLVHKTGKYKRLSFLTLSKDYKTKKYKVAVGETNFKNNGFVFFVSEQTPDKVKMLDNPQCSNYNEPGLEYFISA